MTPHYPVGIWKLAVWLLFCHREIAPLIILDDPMISIKAINDKVASRKLGVTAVAGAAAATGAVEITWPIAAIAMAYIAGQTVVDTWGE